MLKGFYLFRVNLLRGKDQDALFAFFMLPLRTETLEHTKTYITEKVLTSAEKKENSENTEWAARRVFKTVLESRVYRVNGAAHRVRAKRNQTKP